MQDGNLFETLVKKRKERRGEDSSRLVMKTPGLFSAQDYKFLNVLIFFAILLGSLMKRFPLFLLKPPSHFSFFAPHAATPWPLTSGQYITELKAAFRYRFGGLFYCSASCLRVTDVTVLPPGGGRGGEVS